MLYSVVAAMANYIMEDNCQQQQHQDNRQDATASQAGNPAADEHRKPPTPRKKRVRRTSSVESVRKIIEKRFQSISHLMNEKDDLKSAKQWSQSLQDHLETKNMLGPSTHEKEIRKSTIAQYFDRGEGSDTDIILTGQPQHKTYSVSSRLERSSVTDETSSIRLSPASRKSSRNNHSSFTNGSYSGNDSKSLLFPPPPLHPAGINADNHSSMPDINIGSSSTFNGGNDFMDTSSSQSLLDMNMNASKEFTVVRSAGQEPNTPAASVQQPTVSTKQARASSPLPPSHSNQLLPKQAQESPKSKKSFFGKGKPKLAKQLTEFRLLRNGSSRDSSILSDGTKDDDGTDNFSVTTEMLSSTSLPSSSELDIDIDDLLGKKSAKPKALAGLQPAVESLLPNPYHREKQDPRLEIQWRREKYISKLSPAFKNSKDNTHPKENAAQMDFATDLQQSIDKVRKTLKEDTSAPLVIVDDNINHNIKAKGTRPSRSMSTNSASLRKKLVESKPKTRDVTGDGSSLVDMFDDDDSAFFGTAGGGKKKSTQPASILGPAPSIEPTTSFDTNISLASSPANLTKRSHTTSEIPQQSSPTTPKAKPKSQLVIPSTSSRSHRTAYSQRSERTTSSISSGSKKRGENASGRSERTCGSRANSRSERRRRTILALAHTEDLDLDQSFRIRDGEFVMSSSPQKESKKKDDKKKSKKFDTPFSRADKDTANMFHQSFTAEALASPKQNQKILSHGSSMPINTNLLDCSASLLTTVDEKPVEGGRRRPKRRNSLPTGSSHGSVVSKDTLFSSTLKTKPKMGKGKTGSAHESPSNIAKPKLTKTKSIPVESSNPVHHTPRSARGRRRHSVQGPDLAESFAKLRSDLDLLDGPLLRKTKSSTSVTTPSSTSSSRSKRVDSVESFIQVSPEEEQQILAATKMIGIAPPKADTAAPRRRTSYTVTPVPENQPATVEKIRMRRRESSRVRTEKSKLRMKDNSESAVTQRRKDRKSRRHTSNTEKISNSREETKDESRKKHNAHSLSPRTARRVRRTSTAEPNSATSKSRINRKFVSEGSHKPRAKSSRDKSARERSPRRSLRPKFSLSPSTPRLRSLNRGIDDGSQSGRHHRRSARPTRRQTSTDESKDEELEEMSDDSDYEPTPKPVAPPTLPVLATRKTGSIRAFSPVPTNATPRRGHSSSGRARPRRHQSRDESSPELMKSPSVERRRTRSRRQTAHEALKESENIFHSPEKKADKKLTGERSRSPSKSTRLVRRKSLSDKKKTKARRTKSNDTDESPVDNGKSHKPVRRHKTQQGESTPRSSRLRRVKTEGSVLPSINLEAEPHGDPKGAPSKLIDGLNF